MKSFNTNFTLKSITRFFLLAIVALVASSQNCFALIANTPYTLELSKVNSDGTTTLVGKPLSVTSDATGRVDFTFSNVPTLATNRFLIVTVKDAAGVVQIKSFAPAPSSGATGTLGVNTTTTAQAMLMERLGAVVGTDDPVVVAFGLMFTRNPNLSTTDIDNFAIIGQQAIIIGMEPYMLANGATAAQMATFKNKLVYNNAAGSKDLSNFTDLTRSAVLNPAQAQADMAQASGLISDIFVDAAAAANIDLDLILAAFDSAGIMLESGTGQAAMLALSATFRNNMNQAVNNFFTRLSAITVKARYAATLTTLNATTAQITRFNAGVTTMVAAMGAIDTLYAPYFDGTGDMTETINTAHAAGRIDKTVNPIAAAITAWTNAGSPAVGSGNFNPSTMLDPANSTIQNAIDFSFQALFSTFTTDIQSTTPEIDALKTAVASALGITVGQLPQGFGTFINFSGSTVNWPIVQTAAVNFVASVITATGSLTYTRSGLPIPNSMAEWFGSCSNGTSFSRTACTGAGANWTPGTATVFNTGNSSFDALLGMQEDVNIAEQTRFDIFASGSQPTQAQMQTAKQTFITNIATIIGNLGGTSDGATAFTTAQKEALVQAQLQPSLH
jgi:hypothetical protein